MRKMKTIKMLVLLGGITLALSACHSMPKHVSMNDGMKSNMNEFKPKIAVFLDEQGNLLTTGVDGKPLKRCSIAPDGKYEQCRGMQKGNTGLEVKTLTFIKSRINPTCYTTYDGRGRAYSLLFAMLVRGHKSV